MKGTNKGALDFSPKRQALLQQLLRREGMATAACSKIRRQISGVDANRGPRSFPVSFAQERMWFMDRLTPGNPVFNLNCDWRFTYPLEIATLRRSINEMVRRHESLRTTFVATDGEPRQIVADSLNLALPTMDLRDLAEPERDATVLGIATDEARRPFDLTRGPLLRTTLLRLGAEEWVFLLTMHHIISDGWSLQVFWDELLAVWTAYDTGQSSPLADLEIQYSDFSVWQRNWFTGEVLQTQSDYWKRQLAGLTVLELHTDHARPAVQTANGSTHALKLSASLSMALSAFSRDQGVTMFMTLLAAFQSLLFRYTGQDDIAVGTFIANRNRAELEGLIGFFVNTLVLRADCSGEISFRELLKQVRGVTLDAFAHQDLPFAKLVQELHPERDLSRNPLFQVAFQLLNLPGAREKEADSATPVMNVQRGSAVLDITLTMWESAEGLAGEFEYNRDLFDAGTIERMGVHYCNLLADVVARVDLPLHELALLDAEERRRLLIDWNATQADFPRDASLGSLFEAQVARDPGATALLCDGTEVSYAELNRRANRMARRLSSLGVGREARVGVCLERSVEMVIGLLAVLKSGGAYVPLDPAYPVDRLAFIVSDAGIEVLLSQEHLVGRLPRTGAQVLCLENWRAADEDERDLHVPVAPDDLAYVLYTSGSTGRPKGVPAVHRSAVNRLAWMWREYPFEPKEVCCARTSLNFVDSVWEIFGPLLKGIPTVIIREEISRDLSRLVTHLGRFHVTRLWLVPSLLRALLDLHNDLQLRLPRLRFWVTSGDALTPALFRRFRGQMPDAVLYNIYGTTEIWDATWFDPARSRFADDRAPIGRPISNVQVYVLDDYLAPVPVGVPGELCVGGVGVARGYHNLPELTREKFIADPFGHQPDGRLYRTGDRARYLPDGQLEYLGRRDRQVKIRGVRVEPAEVELVLSRHPAVCESAVLARQDASQEPILAAYVVRNSDYDGAELRKGADSWSAEHSRRWQEVWDEIYSNEPAPAHGALNLAGYRSSYTGLPTPQHEMREWLGHSVDTVLSRKPGSVLDIGCGAGLLLFRVAPHCDRYCATDFSRAALSYVEAELRQRNLPNVSLLHRAADDFVGFEPQSFDMVVLNSVVQYFPSIEYLLAVLEGAIRVLRPGGAIYLGAIRSLSLLEVFHASVELDRASARLSIGQLRQRIRKCVAEEGELAIDSSFFHALKNRFPQIAMVMVSPKRGRYQNELTRFRYEVILQVNTRVHSSGELEWLDWRREQLSLPVIQQVLGEGKSAALGVVGIPNGRLTVGFKVLELLAGLSDQDTVANLRDALAAFRDVGVDPKDLWGLHAKLPCTVELQWPATGEESCLHAVMGAAVSGETEGELSAGAVSCDSGAPRPWAAYANSPLQRVLPRLLIPELRRTLQTALPAHMVPSTFVLLEALPLTPSGKLDLAALPMPDRSRTEREAIHMAPRTRTEQVLAGIWTQLLGVERVGAHDNFFEIGGHSLLATRLNSRIRETFQLELPLRAIFETPSIVGLAQLLEEALARGERREESVIVRQLRDARAPAMPAVEEGDSATLSKVRQRGISQSDSAPREGHPPR
jgi:amino acid adenylation domain-containing protein